MYRLLISQAVRPNDADKLTLTLHGPQSADSARLLRVLQHLTGSEEWDGPVPNFDLVVTRDAE